MTAYLSTALIMSKTVNAAEETAVSASISTPVTPRVFTEASIRTKSVPRSKSTVILPRGSGWQRGMISGVRLAPIMPATRATGRASPLGRSASKIMAITSSRVRTVASARAVRVVTDFSVTSTMCAEPSARTWVSSWLGCEVEVIVSPGFCAVFFCRESLLSVSLNYSLSFDQGTMRGGVALSYR